MATARNGQARWIPFVQRLSFATRSASGWIRRRPDEQGDAFNQQTMSDRQVAATEVGALPFLNAEGQVLHC